MDIQKEREAFEKLPEIKKRLDMKCVHFNGTWYATNPHMGNSFATAGYLNGAWMAWQAAKSQAVPEWISIQDRMPEQGKKVLVFRPDAHNHPHKDPNFKICTYAGADIFINSHFEHVITHWKPLESPIEAQEPAND